MLLPILFPLLYANMSAFEESHIEKTTINQSENRDIRCNCVDFVRQFRKDAPSINASDYVPNSDTPVIGAIAVMRYPSGASHVAYVKDVKNGQVLLRHANVVHCKETVEWMDVHNPRLQGYFLAVNI